MNKTLIAAIAIVVAALILTVGITQANQHPNIQQAKDQSYQEGYNIGYSQGSASNLESNKTIYNQAYSNGYTDGYGNGTAEAPKPTQTPDRYQEGYNAGQTAGQTQGYNSGYSKGTQDGYNTGYINGTKAGAGTGYNIRDPTYSEMISFLATDQTDKNTYNIDTYNCYDFTNSLCNDAFNAGYRAGSVYIEFPDTAHAIACFNTTDRGLIFIEPQSDAIMHVAVGVQYWDRTVYQTPSYNDTIIQFGIIW